MTAALEGSEWSAALPGRTLPLGKTRYPFYRRLGGTQGRSGRAEKLVSTGIRSRTVQPVAQSLYRLSYPPHIHIHIIIHKKTSNHTVQMTVGCAAFISEDGALSSCKVPALCLRQQNSHWRTVQKSQNRLYVNKE